MLNPTASKIEQFNETLKTDLADSIASVHKKVDGLRSAEQEWQSVLKKASEKPDAVYKLVKSADGLLTLTGTLATGTLRTQPLLTPQQLALIRYEGRRVSQNPDGFLSPYYGTLLKIN